MTREGLITGERANPNFWSKLRLLALREQIDGMTEFPLSRATQSFISVTASKLREKNIVRSLNIALLSYSLLV
jgi:hypothetical protein